MANFNEKINSHKGLFLLDQCSEYFIERVGSMWMFKQKIDDDLHCRKIAYRLFIQYKTTHRFKKVAGRCFLWDNSHGDHMLDPGNGIELRNMKDASQDNCEGFSNPRFDGMESAILIADRYIFAYGDVQIEADGISQDKKYVVCNVSLCGSIVSGFRIPAEGFDLIFGLKENFPEQDEKVFGKAEDAKPVQEENDLNVMDGDLFDYDTIRDHWREVRGDRVCNSHIRNDHRYAHRVLGDLHCLHW